MVEFSAGTSAPWRTDGEQDVHDVLARVRACLGQVRVCTLGTIGAEAEPPILTPCFFAPLSDLRVVIISSPSSRHAQNVERNAMASLSVSGSAQSLDDRLMSVQMTGRAQRAAGLERARLLATYARRFASGAAALLSADPSAVKGKAVYVLEPITVVLFDTEFCPRAVALTLASPHSAAPLSHLGVARPAG